MNWKRFEYARKNLPGIDRDPESVAREMKALRLYSPRTSIYDAARGLEKLRRKILKGYRPNPMLNVRYKELSEACEGLLFAVNNRLNPMPCISQLKRELENFEVPSE